MPHHHTFQSRSSILAACALLGLAGCGGSSDELPREEVSGEVTLDGQPLDSGSISFMPGSPEIATQGGSTIADGSYSIPEDLGLVPGAYTVRITSNLGDTTPAEDETGMPGMPPPPPKEALPPQYNIQSTLKAEVKTGGPNTFDYELTGATKRK